ncbi:hypothetical protein WJX73_008933 [Symbiochloris irregularis]|uniref:Oxidoreductase-like domain-containing protein n=1 Tax=Symbiochloris irregularis TaxID=706552 RepID=A0AAW1NSU7_9CHLO
MLVCCLRRTLARRSQSPLAGGNRARSPGVFTVSSTGEQATQTASLKPDGKQSDALVKPTEPGPEDCCQTGCKECVWEVYWRELQAYNAELARQKGEAPPLDPFEEMEKRLFGK